MTTSFDRAIALAPVGSAPDPAAIASHPDGAVLRGRTQPDWANMVGPFGGITAAALLHAAQLHPERIGDPLALTVNYAGPLTDGEFDITARATRTNRSTQHWTLEQTQGGAITTTATAVFGRHRDTWADTEPSPPAAPAPEDVARGGLVDAIAWAKRYDMRFTEGAVPVDGQPRASSTTTLWVRDDEDRALDFPALASLCDVFFPRIFLRHGGFVPASTISLSTYFHADAQQLAAVGDDFVLASAHANRFSRGYFDQSAHVWSRGGELLASTHQIVYFKG